MLLIISIIISIIVLIITTYFAYGRIMSHKEKPFDSKSNPKKNPTVVPTDTAGGTSKKGKAKKKPVKNLCVESNVKAGTDEISDNQNQFNVVIPKPNPLDVSNITESVTAVIEPELQATIEPGCCSTAPQFESTSTTDESMTEFVNEKKHFEEQIQKLNVELEEATEKITLHKEEAESLNEENKNIKTKITKLERSKTKFDEQFKKTEKSYSDSLAKNVELERKLAQKNSENVELKQQFDSVTGKIQSVEMKLKSEEDKTKLLQYERECAEKKAEAVLVQSKNDNSSHVHMYKEYENKLEQLNDDIKQMRVENENLNRALAEKSEQNNQLSRELKQLKVTLAQSMEGKGDLNERLGGIARELDDKSNQIAMMDSERNQLLENLDSLRKEFLSKSGDTETRMLQLSEEKNKSDLFITELQLEKSTLQSHIDHLSRELHLNSGETEHKLLEIFAALESKNSELEMCAKEKQHLSVEIDNLRQEVFHVRKEKIDEEVILLAMSQELKQKNGDLTVLQDHKSELLNVIEDLRKELNSRPDNYGQEMQLQLEESVRDKDNVIGKMVEEKRVWKTEVAQLQKQIVDRDNRHMEMETRLRELALERQQLQQNSVKETTTNDFVVDDDRCEMRTVNQDFQMADVADNGRIIEEMQCHIDKLRNEILSLQGKYYHLRNDNPAATIDRPETEKSVKHNVCQTTAVSIPPTIIKHDTAIRDTHFDNNVTTAQRSAAGRNDQLMKSIEKLNAEICEQRLRNQDLQKTFSDTSSEKNQLKTEHDKLRTNYDLVSAKYETVVKQLTALSNSSPNGANNATTDILESQLMKCQEDNNQLKAQLEHYRETLEKTEACLQNIQASVDQEENNWKVCLKSSEQEQQRLEDQIKQLHCQIEELHAKKSSDSSAMV